MERIDLNFLTKRPEKIDKRQTRAGKYRQKRDTRTGKYIQRKDKHREVLTRRDKDKKILTPETRRGKY